MKVLFFFNKNELAPVGGPAGYLYSINNEMQRLKDNSFSFIDYNYTKFDVSSFCDFAFKVHRKLSAKTPEEAQIKTINYLSKRHNSCFECYDAIFFHSTFMLYSQRKDLEKYKGRVFLTSHSPKVSYREIIEDFISLNDYQENKELYDSTEKFDEYAFRRADYIIFPCPGAEEPYYHSWSRYAELRDEKKIRYIPTGILSVECKKSRKEIRNELGIPQDAIVLSFVGRHNEVKGYDILQNIFFKLDNAYVICCGKIGSIQPPKSDRWIEVGWTTDPYSYVGASDIYILPNRETYFDIAMLQTLSIGKCSVISNTGGNKEFTNTPGVKLYNSIDEAVQCIKHFIDMDFEDRKRLENIQRKEFNEKYTIQVFYEKYKETIRNLIENR